MISVDSTSDYGYNVLEKKYTNLVSEAGIIDPTSVIISEVENAASIAGLLLTTAGAIVDVPDEKQTAEPSEPDGLGM